MKRQQWIAMLAKLTAPMHSATAAQAFTAYLPMLAYLPDEAFCEASLKAVARECDHTPTFGTVQKAFDAWWKQHRPPPAELPPPLPSMRLPPDDAERACVSRTTGEIIAGCHAVSERKDALTRGGPVRPSAGRPISRELLNELYRRAGVVGPQVSAPRAADVIPMFVRRAAIQGPPP